MAIPKRFKSYVFLTILIILLSPFSKIDTRSIIKISYAAEGEESEEDAEEARRKKEAEDRQKNNIASKVKIIYPKDNMILYEQRDWIAGVHTEKGPETVDISVINVATGEVIENEAVELEDNGQYMYPAEFAPGNNKITAGTFVINIFYKEDDAMEVPDNFKEMLVHQSVPDLCEECHDIFDESRQFPLLKEQVDEICENCHKSRIFDRLRKAYKNVHEPVKKGECTTCHDIHISPNERMLLKPQNELCADCHKAFIGKVKSNKFIHLGDMFDKICSKCHNPHSSNVKKLIRDVRKGICKKCHEAFTGEKEGLEYKSIHKPVVQGKCFLCHDIHSGANKMFLIESDAKKTCMVCHGEKAATGHGSKLANCPECHNSHISEKEGLFTEKGIKKCLECHKDLNYKQDIEQKRNCQLCHSPHSNQNVEMAMESCENCHNAEKLSIKHSDLTPNYDMCSRCHQMHGEGGKGLLRRNTHPLKEKRCKACHTSKDIETAKTSCLECHKGVYDAKHPLTAGKRESCITCHNVHGNGIEKMIAEVQHKPFKEGKCDLCHKSIEESLLLPAKANTGELCLTCHKELDLDSEKVEFSSKHKPFEKNECIKCHSTHASFYPKLALKKKQQLCYKCHKSKELDDLGNFFFSIHQPINAGDCLKCHSPHGSQNKFMLSAKGPDLCFSCHKNFIHKIPKTPQVKGGLTAGKLTKEEIEKLPKFKTIHKPINEKGCVACHSPHSSEEKKLLIAVPGVFFCFKCHEDFTVDDEGYNRKSVHEPVLNGECNKCHSPHANDNPSLLLEMPNNLCLQCHRRLEKTHHKTDKKSLEVMTKVPESFLLDGPNNLFCTNCHDPHSSFETGLIRGFKKDLCLLCHSSVPG